MKYTFKIICSFLKCVCVCAHVHACEGGRKRESNLFRHNCQFAFIFYLLIALDKHTGLLPKIQVAEY